MGDGRIHPARIEQAYSRAVDKVHDKCQEAAQSAIMELGLVGINPGLYQYIVPCSTAPVTGRWCSST